MSDFNDNAKEIKNKATKLYDSAKENAANAYYETKPKAEELAAQIGTTATDLYECGKEGIIKAEGYVEETLTDIAKAIRKQPLHSVLLAAAVGYLWAKLTK
jgi:ElaB/YqjD/DUF883 family membrane-anchored ribosome-binding protein